MSTCKGKGVKHTVNGFLSGARKHCDIIACSSLSGSRQTQLLSDIYPKDQSQRTHVRPIIFTWNLLLNFLYCMTCYILQDDLELIEQQNQTPACVFESGSGDDPSGRDLESTEDPSRWDLESTEDHPIKHCEGGGLGGATTSLPLLSPQVKMLN
jgi:hypothetical protein